MGDQLTKWQGNIFPYHWPFNGSGGSRTELPIKQLYNIKYKYLLKWEAVLIHRTSTFWSYLGLLFTA